MRTLLLRFYSNTITLPLFLVYLEITVSLFSSQFFYCRLLWLSLVFFYVILFTFEIIFLSDCGFLGNWLISKLLCFFKKYFLTTSFTKLCLALWNWPFKVANTYMHLCMCVRAQVYICVQMTLLWCLWQHKIWGLQPASSIPFVWSLISEHQFHNTEPYLYLLFLSAV